MCYPLSPAVEAAPGMEHWPPEEYADEAATAASVPSWASIPVCES